MPEIQVKDKLITLEELGTAYNNSVKKTGDTMTGPLTVDANIMQPTGYISGDVGTLNHAIKLGHIGDDVMEFNEYGGLYNFYRNASDPRELIFQINGSQGTSAAPLPVTSGGTGATTAAQARANLEITPANIGAVAKSGDTMTGTFADNNALLKLVDNSSDTTTYKYCLSALFPNMLSGQKIWMPLGKTYGILGETGGLRFDYNNSGGDPSNNALVLAFWGRDVLTAKYNGDIDLYNPLSIGNGGTGATTPAGARVNLELTPSAWQTIATGIYIMKVGNMAFISCTENNVIALPPKTWVTLGYLPNGYVPAGSFYGTILNGGNGEQNGILRILDSGTIQYFNSGTEQETVLWGSMTFPISNN